MLATSDFTNVHSVTPDFPSMAASSCAGREREEGEVMEARLSKCRREGREGGKK